jgi:hypothetical protein
MRRTRKPVHKCYSCLLNLGDHCWLYKYPRGQWRSGKTCRAADDAGIHKEFRKWKKQPVVKTRKELRREFFRTRKRTVVHRESSQS